VTRRTWNPRGELATEVDPEGGVVSYAYDAGGNLATVTDALGHATAYTYDARATAPRPPTP
jgi:YD repeat-containing protein